MGKKRNRLEIIYDILMTLKRNPSIKKTHLMYKTNLTYVRLNNYLEELRSKEFITEDEETTLTEKGEHLIREVRKMREFMDSFGL
jgi:predicted transcriptional regulator